MFECFGVSAAAKVPEEGYWCYAFSHDDTELRLSVNTHETSIQTQLLVRGEVRMTVSREGLSVLKICGRELLGQFADQAGFHTALVVRPALLPACEWSGLVVDEP